MNYMYFITVYSLIYLFPIKSPTGKISDMKKHQSFGYSSDGLWVARSGAYLFNPTNNYLNLS